MVNRIGLCLLAMAITGCSGHGMIDTEQSEYLVSIKLYDSVAAIRDRCGAGNAGCYECNADNSVCAIHSIRERCVFDHEVEHVFEGPFHGEHAARSCKSRANMDKP